MINIYYTAVIVIYCLCLLETLLTLRCYRFSSKRTIVRRELRGLQTLTLTNTNGFCPGVPVNKGILN